MIEAQTRPANAGGLWKCQFCKNRLHGSCPGAVRMRDRLWVCYCPECSRPPRCLECGQDSPDELDITDWRCLDPANCRGRVALRLSNSPAWRMLQECRTREVSRQRQIRERAERIRTGLDPYEEEDTDPRPRIKRVRAGVCECGCDGMTKGGKFCPGHDSRLLSRLRKAVATGDTEAAAELIKRGWDKHH